MNIFILDRDLKLNAQYHNDKHVVKMITEQNQIVCSVLRLKGYDCIPYKLCKEYSYRYSKTHKGEGIANELKAIVSKLIDRYIPPKDFPITMSEEISKGIKRASLDETIRLHRLNYRMNKRHLAAWKNRETPDWWS